MRFKQYLLTEEMDIIDNIYEFNDTIKEQCKPYLRLLKGNLPLFRGMNVTNTIGIKQTYNRRLPRGTRQHEFNVLNQWLLRNHHNRRDKNIVIGTSNGVNVDKFGTPCYIFPIGQISYTWIDAKDYNITYPKTGWDSLFLFSYINDVDFDITYPDDNISIKEYEKDYRTRMSKPFADYFHTDKGFDIAYKNGYEIWFHCKSYYYVDAEQITRRWNWKWDKGQFWKM